MARIVTVIAVVFTPVSEAARVGYGRPYTVTYSDGTTRAGVQTWDRPAPEIGDKQAIGL